MARLGGMLCPLFAVEMVESGAECGISLTDFASFEAGDVIETYVVVLDQGSAAEQ